MDSLNVTNQSNDDALLDIYTLNAIRASFLTGNTVVLYFYLVIGVIGNFLVFYVYKFCITKHRTDRFFIPYLAVSDALSCIIGSGFAISLNVLPLRFSGDGLCKSMWFVTKWSTLISALMLLLIAVERYKKVCTPFGSQLTPLAKQMAVMVLIVISAVLTFPTIFFHGEIEFVARGTSHLIGHRCGRTTYISGLGTYFTVYNGILATCAVTGISIVTVLYYFVGKTIYKQTKFRSRFASSPRKSFAPNPPKSDSGVGSDGNDDVFVEDTNKDVSENKKRKDSSESFYSTDDDLEGSEVAVPRPRSENLPRRKSIVSRVYTVQQILKKYKISILFMLITLVFILTFTPRLVIMIMESANKDFWTGLTDNEIRVNLFFYRFYIVNNIGNPFLYAAFDPRFTQEIKKRLPCFQKL